MLNQPFLSRLIKYQQDRKLTRSEKHSLFSLSTGIYDRPRISLVVNQHSVKAQQREFRKLFQTLQTPDPDYKVLDVPMGDGLITQSDFINGQGQGSLGTCTLISAAADNVAYQQNENGTWTFRFYDSLGTPVYTTVTAQRSAFGSIGDFGVFERAYAGNLQQTKSVLAGQTAWQDIGNGTNMGQALAKIKGSGTETYRLPLMSELTIDFQAGKTILVANLPNTISEYVFPSHAYRVVGVGSDGSVTVRNPWGFDGLKPYGNAKDGLIRFDSYNQFAQNFSNGYFAVG
jgi:hypothetical protein